MRWVALGLRIVACDLRVVATGNAREFGFGFAFNFVCSLNGGKVATFSPIFLKVLVLSIVICDLWLLVSWVVEIICFGRFEELPVI